MPDDDDDDDSPESEKPAASKPAERETVEAKEPEKPVSKSVEWALAFAMMAILVGFLFLMMYLMRSARSSVM